MSNSHSEIDVSTGSNEAFRLVVSADVLQRTVALVHSLVDECRIQFDAEAIRISAVDPALVASVELTVDRSAFEAYDAADCCIGVDLERFRDVVKMANRDQLVALTLDPATRKLEIRIDELSYTLALLDPESIRSPHDHSEFELEFAGTVVTEAGEIDRAIRAADMVSDHLTLRIDEDEEVFYMEADGDTDELSLELSASSLVELTPNDARSMFSIDYLEPINRATPSDVELDLEIGTEAPVAVRYEFADGAGDVEYLVSPRITT
ncbi:DNA polymerase sliding clamp [Natronococcus pandeyae]|uniref:DNA polymerase sliding clamp n=1 Tax=Natronococcus pandeyae TaxID=2055836 RepID=A0A8J8Q0S4_9EURY|nr:DNA polymerase sliding clamp [Natronococcus pandeyae]TYL36867.1 DNA polymerase sliding clamp [Natronococcus pandeyae]